MRIVSVVTAFVMLCLLLVPPSANAARHYPTQRHNACHWTVPRGELWPTAKPCEGLFFGGRGDGLPF